MTLPVIVGQAGLPPLPPDDIFFGRSPLMAIARMKLLSAASSTLPVLLQGESGTGKEIMARLLHVRSQRARFPWIKVICPAIPDSLVESELFGYERGAFSGATSMKPGRIEQADRGTLFLDEIGSMDLPTQAKLLQLLQDGTFMRVGGQQMRRVDARIVSSANFDLKTRADEGSFRADLLYRLNAVTIALPPLRHRLEDLPALVEYFYSNYCRSLQRDPGPLSGEMTRVMRQFTWPGNIRQLQNMVRSYVLFGDEEALAAEFVSHVADEQSPEIDLAHPVSLKQITKSATERLERKIIFEVLRANGGSRLKTARWLNISYRSLLYKLEQADLAGYSFGRRARREYSSEPAS